MTTTRAVVVRALILFAFFATAAGPARSQISNVTGETETPMAGTGRDYIHSLNESVDPATGALNLTISVPVPPGRNVNLPFAFTYSSNSAWHMEPLPTLGTATPHWELGIAQLGGWSFAVPSLSRQEQITYPPTGNPSNSPGCSITTSYIFTDPSGGRHAFGIGHVDNYETSVNGIDYNCALSSLPGSAGDGQYQAALVGAVTSNLNPNPDTDGNPTIVDADGTVYSFGSGWGCGKDSSGSYQNYGLPASIEDRNGNLVTISTTYGQNSICLGSSFSVVNALGTIISASNFGQSPTTVAILGLPSPSYTLTWESSSPTGLMISNHQLVTDSDCGGLPTTAHNLAPSVVSEIALPNGQSYTFTYDSVTGFIQQIIYPTGGTVTYTWGVSALGGATSYNDSQGNLGGCQYTYDAPVVTKRVETIGGTETLEQDFSYTTAWSSSAPWQWTQKTTTVVTKDLVRNVSYATKYTYRGITVGPQPGVQASPTVASQLPVEQMIQYSSTGSMAGTILRTVTKNWGGYYSNVPMVACETDMLDNNDTAGVFYAYGVGDVVTDKKEYDFTNGVTATNCTNDSPPASPTRETVTAYQTFLPTPIFTSGTTSIFDRPSSVITYSGGTAGTRVAETDYAYDGFAVSGITGTNAHDDTYYGSAYNNRGNATKVTRQCFPNCTSAVTQYNYDQTGQVTSIIDPCGYGTCSDVAGTNHTTEYFYTDRYTPCSGSAPTGTTNALLTQIVYPSTNGVAHIRNFCYGYADGQLRSSSDENSNVTTYVYDSIGRLSETEYPGSGLTSYSYHDTPLPATVTVTSKVNSSGTTITTESVMDGVARVAQSTLTYGSGSTATTNIQFDGFGHKYTITNPYFSAGDPTYGVTTYSYDALGRVTQVKNADSSIVSTSYTGRATQMSDEGNGSKLVQRVSQTDYLGRLSSMCEISATTLPNGTSGAPSACGQDIGANGFPTTYSYDVLGNLLMVSQGGLASRSFQYNSLSELTSSTNPESNTAPTGGTVVATTYAYDLNGNLSNKTEPAQNQTGIATATLTYCYDALNRMTAKGYTSQTCSNTGSLPSPAASYVFDTCPTTGCPTGYPTNPNSIGHLVESYTSTAGSIAQTFSSYDSMGRVLNEWQCTPQTCGSSYFALPYTYDLVGDLLTGTNGQGVTFTYAYPAGQLTELTSSLSDSNHPATLFSGATYNAPGVVTSATLGNGMTETRGYSNRVRPQTLTVAASSSTATTSTGGAAVTGSEQSYQANPTGSSGKVSLGGTCGSSCPNGTATVIVGTYHAVVHFTTGATFASIGSSLASAVGGSGLVTAYATDLGGADSISMYSDGTGSSTNYTVSCSIVGGYFSISCSNMTGGTNGGPVYDTGTVSVTVNGFVASTAYNSSSTSATLASALASQLNGSSSPVTAVLSGSVMTLTSKATGAAANYTISDSSVSNNPSNFSPPSFLVSDSGGTLVGGAGGYDFALTYAPNGNVLAANDSVNGNWTYTYDDFNRVLTATKISPSNLYTYDYDRYGNRWHQYLSGACTAGTTFCLTFDTNNRVSSGAQTYDAAGNVIQDSMHHYYYDAENHLLQVDGTFGTCSTATACYVYDANGQRVEKIVAGASLYYLYDLAGHPFTEINSSGSWDRTEIYAAGRHLATYSGGASGQTEFDHADWLGTERARTNLSAVVCDSITSLPFGDGLTTSGSCGDPSPLHFTGKERDSESNLDNFGARYNSSAIGRFMSPDPSPNGIALADPQSWNLYSYVRNRPTRSVDVRGNWATDIHAEITTFALQDYVSAGELKMLVNEQYVMDRDQSDQSHHAMAMKGQSAKDAENAWEGYVESKMTVVSQGLNPDGSFTANAIRALGDAIHALQDYTSPMHTDANFNLMVWTGGRAPGQWGTDMHHYQGESSPDQDWARIGLAVRLSMAARLESGAACEPGKRCLSAANFESEYDRDVTHLVESYYNTVPDYQRTRDISEDEARQCALGNPAACPF
jgi:RHS repeat-associated protein